MRFFPSANPETLLRAGVVRARPSSLHQIILCEVAQMPDAEYLTFHMILSVCKHHAILLAERFE